MKRIGLCLLIAAMALTAALGCAEAADALFETLEGLEWSFCSGAGAWSTDMRIFADGSFSGEFHDGEIGEDGEAYPYGTVYICDFTGKLSVVERQDENTWKLRVEALAIDESRPEEVIEDGVRFVRAEPYGLAEGGEMLLYAPGTPLTAIPEDMRFWTHALDLENPPETLEDWFLSSEENGSGFVSWRPEPMADMPNPWKDLTAEELQQEAGIVFGIPEGAESIVTRYLPGEKLAEMQFTLDGDEYCARVQPFVPEGDVLPEISGMYFAWENEEAVTVRGCRGTIGQAQCGSEDWVERCLWYDEAAGLAYALSVSTTDLDGLDLTAVAEQVCCAGK